MRFLTALCLAAALSACTPCDAVFTTFTPVDGAGPVGRATPIRVLFDGQASAIDFEVTGPDGAIPGTVTLEEGAAVFTPDAAYPSEGEITWTAAACEGTVGGTFSTGTLEERMSPEELEGSAYSIDLAEATWVSPPNAGDMISQFFAGTFLIGVEAATETELDCIGAAGEATASGSWQQDPCYPTVDFDAVDFSSNPYFALVSDRLEFNVEGMAVIIHEVTISGGMSSEELSEGKFSGEVDMRDYTGALGDDPCSLVGLVGLTCEACLSDGEEQCIWLEAEDVGGERVGGLSIVANENPEECEG
jgi:hypothetical protein